MNLIEKFREISGGKSSLDLGDSSLKIKADNEKCPNPTCNEDIYHCGVCKEEYGIWVCGTNKSGHHVFNPQIGTMPIFRNRPRFDKGDVRHSEIHWKDMLDDDVKRVFNIYDKEIRKRGWVDVRKDKL